MKKIISIFIVFVFFINTNSIANSFFNIPLWEKDYSEITVNAEVTHENFLNLESESAILIEQSTR